MKTLTLPKSELKSSHEKIHSDTGIVLKRNRHLENDVRICLFLRHHGKVQALAKGGQRINSKLKGLLEPFAFGDYQVFLPHQGVSSRLISGSLRESHRSIRMNLAAFELACKCCEVVDMLLPFRAPSEDIFDHLQATFRRFQFMSHPKVEWINFVTKILKDLGHGDFSDYVSRHSVDQSLAFLNHHLNRILPWPLKSNVLTQIGS